MAVFKVGALVSDVRGKLGDVVFTRGQGGATIRSIGTWIQPNNAAQLACRATMDYLATSWSEDLDEAERSSWRIYAASHPRPNQWGTACLTNGYASFIRHNFYSCLDQGSLQFSTAPTAPPIHPPILTVKVQQDGTIHLEGVITPDATGLYHPAGQYENHPYWKRFDNAYFIWYLSEGGAWICNTSLGVAGNDLWYKDDLAAGSWEYNGTYTGNPTHHWQYDASLARITTPPLNYINPSAGLTLYLYSGIPVTAGRSYYSGPWLALDVVHPAVAAVAATTWLRWTWPTRSVEPPWTWPLDGSGSARLRTIAQDASTGAMSTPHFSTPTFGSLTPW